MSLEWARLLLNVGGARHIVLLTVGKYGSSHTHYSLKPGMDIDPYAANTGLTPDDLIAVDYQPSVDRDVSERLRVIIEAMTGVFQ